jgi:iron complex outermembrane receptor protein
LTFFDVHRVEVLRGPQGTLYGRNATGGSINVISNPPTEELEAYGDIQFGNYNQIRSRWMLNAPFIGDRVMARVSIFQEDRDGYQKNLANGTRRNDADDARDFALRAQLRAVPSDDIELIVRGLYERREGIGPASKILGDLPSAIYLDPDQPPLDLYGANNASLNPSNPRKIRLDHIGDRDESPWSVNATLVWNLDDLFFFGDAQLTATGSFARRDDERSVDADLTDIPLLVVGWDDEVDEYVAETRLASAGSGPLEWVFGVFYLHSSQDLRISGRSFPFSSSLPEFELTTMQLTDRTAQSAAVFGQASYTIWNDWRITAGLRYNYDEKDSDFVAPPVFFFESDDEPFIPGTASNDDDSWSAVTGKAGIDWFWRDGSMAYFSASRGYKAGTIETAPRLDPETGDPTGGTIANADPEYIWAYELGSKNRFLDDRLQLNLTGFYYDYDDLQVAIVAENVIVTQNAAKATVWGFELELTALPVPELLIVANGSYLNTEFDDFIGFREEDRFQQPVDFSGNQLPRAPEFSGNLMAEYRWDLGRWGTLAPRVQFYASDDVYFRAANDDSDKQDSYTKTDLRLAWQSEDERISLEAFADNVTDEDVIQSQVVGSSLTGWPITTALDAPRTYGVRIGYRWGG